MRQVGYYQELKKKSFMFVCVCVCVCVREECLKIGKKTLSAFKNLASE